MTPEERTLLNTEAMHDDADRTFCGNELGPLTIVSRRYIERMISRFKSISASDSELALGYAFLLSRTVSEMRRLSRDFDTFEAAMDEWIAKLPESIPAAELEKLNAIAQGDLRHVEAATVEIAPKPGAAAAGAGAPPNS